MQSLVIVSDGGQDCSLVVSGRGILLDVAMNGEAKQLTTFSGLVSMCYK